MASHDPALVDEDERIENFETKLWYECWVVSGHMYIGGGPLVKL